MDELDLSSRVARLETSLGEMQKGQAAIVAGVERLSGEFQAARRPQYQLLLGLAGFLMALGTAAAALIMQAQTGALAPIATQASAAAADLQSLEERVGRVQEKVDLLGRDLSALTEHQTEIETQFESLSNYSNLADQSHETYLKLLWRKVYGEVLPLNGDKPTVGR